MYIYEISWYGKYLHLFHLGKASRKKSPELSGIFPKRGGMV